MNRGQAGFLRYEASQVLQYFQTQPLGTQSPYGLSPGACTVFSFGFDGGGDELFTPAAPAPLDAGPVININGPRGRRNWSGFATATSVRSVAAH